MFVIGLGSKVGCLGCYEDKPKKSEKKLIEGETKVFGQLLINYCFMNPQLNHTGKSFPNWYDNSQKL